MHRGFLMIGSLLGALAVALGAFGAHALKQRIPADDLAIYQTGVQYHFYHVAAIFIVAFLWGKFNRTALLWAGRAFITGIFLFSGSLYLMTWQKAFASGYSSWLGAITPIGGVFFIIGWMTTGYIVNKGKVKD